MAIVTALVVETITIGLCFLMILGNAMSDNPGMRLPVGGVFWTGTIASTIVAATHWIRLSW